MRNPEALDALLTLTGPELAALLRRCHPLSASALDDYEYRGVTLGMPALVERLTWKVFKKVFCREADGRLRGWNVRLAQRGLDAPCEPLLRAGQPRTFGHFAVVSGDGYRPPIGCAGALMLDYGRGGNHPLDPTGLMRDPLAALNPGSADLLLGYSYLDLGWPQVYTPTWFVLERDQPLTHRHDPPRPRRA